MEKQIQKGKEGEVGGVFGYSTRIEELAKKIWNNGKRNRLLINKIWYTR